MINHFVLTLPYPDSRLSPNARLSWQAKLKIKAAAKNTAYLAVKDVLQGCDPSIGQGPFEAVFTAYPPDKRHRDVDNFLSAMKAAQDGMCIALEINDAAIRRTTVQWGEVKPGGSVKVELKALD